MTTKLKFQVSSKGVAYQYNYTLKGTKKKKKPALRFDVGFTYEDENVRGSITFMHLSKAEADTLEVGDTHVFELVDLITA